jgi:hypothetical protein
MIVHLIEWKSSSFESPVKFSAVAGGLPEKVWGETPYLFRMIGHEWKKLQNLSIIVMFVTASCILQSLRRRKMKQVLRKNYCGFTLVQIM